MEDPNENLVITNCCNSSMVNVLRCRCQPNFLFGSCRTSKKARNDLFIAHAIEQPGLPGELETSYISIFDMSHCGAIFKNFEDFIGFKNKLSGSIFSPFFHYIIID